MASLRLLTTECKVILQFRNRLLYVLFNMEKWQLCKAGHRCAWTTTLSIVFYCAADCVRNWKCHASLDWRTCPLYSCAEFGRIDSCKISLFICLGGECGRGLNPFVAASELLVLQVLGNVLLLHAKY